jgi:hypothetical protein
LRAEGFSCSLNVLYGGLGLKKLHFLICKSFKKFSPVNSFLEFVVIKTPDPDRDSREMLDPDFGSTTLTKGTVFLSMSSINMPSVSNFVNKKGE